MSTSSRPASAAEAKALFEYFRSTYGGGGEVPWYAVVYLPPEIREQFPVHYDALVQGFEELQRNTALSQKLFGGLLANPFYDRPISMHAITEFGHPQLWALRNETPLAYFPESVSIPRELRHSMPFSPEVFRENFIEKRPERLARVVQDGMWPLSSLLAHELDHAMRGGMVRYGVASTAVQQIAQQACFEAQGVAAENEQRAFLHQADPVHYGQIQPRDGYVNMRVMVDALVKEFLANPQALQQLRKEGLEHPAMQRTILRGMLNAGCGQEAEARKDQIIRGAIAELSQRLGVELPIPQVPVWVDTSKVVRVSHESPEAPASTPNNTQQAQGNSPAR